MDYGQNQMQIFRQHVCKGIHKIRWVSLFWKYHKVCINKVCWLEYKMLTRTVANRYVWAWHCTYLWDEKKANIHTINSWNEINQFHAIFCGIFLWKILKQIFWIHDFFWSGLFKKKFAPKMYAGFYLMNKAEIKKTYWTRKFKKSSQKLVKSTK